MSENNVAPIRQEEKFIIIPLATLNIVAAYLREQPFKDVASILQMMQQTSKEYKGEETRVLSEDKNPT